MDQRRALKLSIDGHQRLGLATAWHSQLANINTAWLRHLTGAGAPGSSARK
jgi:hypothetical protein